MVTVKVSARYQIVVPSEARHRLGIQPGDRLSVEVRDDELILRRRPARPSERLRGLFKGMYEGKDAVESVRELREESERWRETSQ